MSLSRKRWRFHLNDSSIFFLWHSQASVTVQGWRHPHIMLCCPHHIREHKTPINTFREWEIKHITGKDSMRWKNPREKKNLQKTKWRWPTESWTTKICWVLYSTSPTKCWCCKDAMIVTTGSDAIGGRRKRWHFWRRARGTEGGNESAQEGTERDSKRIQRENSEGQRDRRRGEEPWRRIGWLNQLSSSNYHWLFGVLHSHTYSHA